MNKTIIKNISSIFNLLEESHCMGMNEFDASILQESDINIFIDKIIENHRPMAETLYKIKLLLSEDRLQPLRTGGIIIEVTNEVRVTNINVKLTKYDNVQELLIDLFKNSELKEIKIVTTDLDSSAVFIKEFKSETDVREFYADLLY